MTTANWHFYLMAFMYFVAGLFHFAKPKAYVRIMPTYIPYPKAMVLISGLAEIFLGIGLLFNSTKKISIFSIVIMLLVFFTVHIHMLKSSKASIGVPKWFLWLRIPLQFILIWWAVYYL